MVNSVEKLYVIGAWYKDEKLIGARVIDIECTRSAKTGDKIPIMDFENTTLLAGIGRDMIVNLYVNKQGEICGKHGILLKYPRPNDVNKKNIVIIGKRNHDTVDYITVDGVVHTCGIHELYNMRSHICIANATVFVKNDNYVLKGTSWKIKDDLTLAEIFIDNK